MKVTSIFFMNTSNVNELEGKMLLLLGIAKEHSKWGIIRRSGACWAGWTGDMPTHHRDQFRAMTGEQDAFV